MKDRSVLPALIKVIDGDWVFTMFIAVIGDEEVRKGIAMGESTRVVLESHSGTGGGRREERLRSMAGGGFRVGEVGRKKKGEERRSADVLPVGTRAKSGQAMVNSWFSSNSKKLNFGPVGTEMTGIATTDGDEAFSDENGQAIEREAQSLLNFSPLNVAKLGCNLKGPLRLGQGEGEKKTSEKQVPPQREEATIGGKGKGVPDDHDVQTRGSAKKEVKFGSKKLWNTLFPPSSNRRQGSRSYSEPLLLE